MIGIAEDLTHEADVRILLSDDDPRLLQSLRDLLKMHDYQVDVALGGVKALQMLQQGHYDLLLLDLSMPEVDGHEVMRVMNEKDIATMTIVISGNTSIDGIATALRAGAYDYLKKPYMPEELLATVNNAVRRKRLEDSHKVIQVRLNRSERLHRLIVNHSPDIVYILDHLGRFSFLNATVTKLLGYSPDELLGISLLDIMEEDQQEKGRYFLEQARQPYDEVRSLEVALRPKVPGRSRRHFELIIWPMQDDEQPLQDGNQYRTYGTARDITERMEAEAFISFQAYHDLLTRLPNRALFKDRLGIALTQAAREGHQLAVMFIDLDRFKVINDSLGHTIGDRLLQAVSQRLQACVRKGDTLSRFGGDEFTLLLPEVRDWESAAQVADKILASIRAPFRLDGHEVFIGASIGIAMFPAAGANMDALIKNADIAMYRVKNTGRDGFQLFTPDMAGSTRRLQLEQEMHRGLAHQEFDVVYQAQVHAARGEVVGVEALIRWNHPTLGRLEPSEFISIAEESRLIVELDRSTLRRAARDVSRYRQRSGKELRLSVNMSPILVTREDFVQTLLETLQQESFPPRLLEIEITENLLLSDRQDVIDKLHRLSEAGIRIAIDDFGTGYSSLSYLQKLPINTLKIDRSFTHRLKSCEEGSCIVNAIIAMALGLKMDIVVEGVETESQLDYLKTLGCTVMQGFLYGEPDALEAACNRAQEVRNWAASVSGL
ncbi:EAL domain-containing protein [Thioalkalivibrio sp.]|uniref:EAL domain-containing protein n=1 Tax=Thioalkalivibrio sp. TaxID=2093813 RepID=UPI0012D4E5E0|nr:EAL domain-containing protein [Thioalkalivibrio sp.]TVP82566.1 MAG: EAL domain-containing protein [Thioalkalivibrio sp.]